MRAYTIYKDERGKIFASFDDMIDRYPIANAVGKLTIVKQGKASRLQDMIEAKKIAIVKES